MPNLILDTCGLIWLVNGGGELSKKTLQQIQKAEIVFVRSASAIEIGCKYALGKLELPLDPMEWYRQVLSHYDLIEIPIDSTIGFYSATLPLIHKDPADRLIIATSLLKDIPVVTHDSMFVEYGVKVIS